MIIEYKDGIDPTITGSNPHDYKCMYCDLKLKCEPAKKITKMTMRKVKPHFIEHKNAMEEIHGPFENWYFKTVTGLNYEGTRLAKCLACGWWSIVEEYWIAAEWQIWQLFYGLDGIIKDINVADASVPINELRSFLIRKYTKRFYVNPKSFEHLAASVFSDLGYNTVCTGYSKDGGIDLILNNNSNTIGVQIKRTKNNIKVEQIRAFLGAMVVNGYNKGFFVSTSNFQSGCNKIANRVGIELINASKFYDALKEAQIIHYNDEFAIDHSSFSHLHFIGCYPMNSL